ncbi:MAG: hypothetical protein H6631_04060 [Anaerolineaceae bacterium]|nr:hypothetical protein [Anaerolineaceae bacterium]
MPTEFARNYIHPASAGNKEACSQIFGNLRTDIGELLKAKKISGYRLFVIKDADHAENELVSFFCNYSEITEGKFPFIYVELQPAEEKKIDLDAIMSGMNFYRCN